MASVLPKSWQSRLNPTQRFGLRLTLVALAVILVAVPFALLLFQVLAGGPLTHADSWLANRLNAWVHGHPSLVRVFEWTSWLGKPPVLAVFVVLGAAYCWWRRQWRLSLFLVATSLLGGFVDSAVKILVDRPRPVVDHPVATALGKSFPSGHAMSSTIVFGALLVVFLPVVGPLARRAAVGLAIALVLAIGTSRLLLGVHFLSDVVGGYVLGVAWLAAATAVFETWRVDRGLPKSEPLADGVEPEAEEALT